MFALLSVGLSNLCLLMLVNEAGRGRAMGRVAMARICSFLVLMPRGLRMVSAATTSSCICVTRSILYLRAAACYWS